MFTYHPCITLNTIIFLFVKFKVDKESGILFPLCLCSYKNIDGDLRPSCIHFLKPEEPSLCQVEKSAKCGFYINFLKE